MKLRFLYWDDNGMASLQFRNWCLMGNTPYAIGTTEPEWDFIEGVEQIMVALREELT